jgi:predicted nucleic acid-binding protein
MEEAAAEQKIRDVKDRPILRAAISAKADFLLTGDKDFLDSGVTHPEIITATDFMAR